jgi:hypothetical protein
MIINDLTFDRIDSIDFYKKYRGGSYFYIYIVNREKSVLSISKLKKWEN